MKHLHVIYACDEKYLPQVEVAASSALAWCSEHEALSIHLLDVGISDDAWTCFEGRIRLNFGSDFQLIRHTISEDNFNALRKYHGSLATYARLLLPEILSDISWCVYCDGDTLFVQDPLKLKQLFDCHYAIQGHGESCSAEHIKWFSDRGVEWIDGQYVCTGFIFMNLEWFRNNNAGGKCLDFLREHPDAPFVDQDALYAICKGHVGFLPDEWGSFSPEILSIPREGLIHFAHRLPWNQQGRKSYSDVDKLWYCYARRYFGGEGGIVRDAAPTTKGLLGRFLFVGLAFIDRLFPDMPLPFKDRCRKLYVSRARWRKLTACLYGNK